MAGFITSLTFDYTDSTWDTSDYSKAPLTVTISMGFSPIFDLPVGLDADGRLRALSHPANRELVRSSRFGHPYENDADFTDGKILE